MRAVAQQRVRPYEVIVVDNNSTDTTAAIAAQFPFVRLVREGRQGVVHARRRGFDEARGAIIGSIDADTDLPADWVQTVQEVFAETGASAVTGVVRYRDIAWAPLISYLDRLIRRYFAHLYAGVVPLQGANMAVRRSTWLGVRSVLCARAGLHEDLDLAVHLGEMGRSAILDERLHVTIGSRQCALDWQAFYVYAAANPRSYGQHGLGTRSMWCLVALVVPLYPLLRVLHQGYDRTRQRFSWMQLLRGDLVARVNPATFVD